LKRKQINKFRPFVKEKRFMRLIKIELWKEQRKKNKKRNNKVLKLNTMNKNKDKKIFLKLKN
jgi:hypothetical protein